MSKLKASEIITTVSREYEIPEEEILGPCRATHIVEARHISMALMSNLLHWTPSRIASYFDLTWATVRNGIRHCETGKLQQNFMEIRELCLSAEA